MSPSEIAVSVRGLSKAYTIAHNDERQVTLAEQMLQRLRNPFKRAQTETFWALKDIDFDIKKGDVVGIIGRNGAGKSTLLKILSRITEPTAGEIRLYGRVGSLLEVGTGFHPELTGRENIYLNGQILGMRKAEISKQFDAIVDFAGVEKFLDTPVKRYSSGMYVRLAFAVAAHLESEILIVDEVLAVGDAEFQRKCLGKMKDVATGGRTVVFVSHHMQSVQILCNRAMFMERGQLTYFGGVEGGIERYVSSFRRPSAEASSVSKFRGGTGEIRFSAVTTSKEFFTSGEEKLIRFKLSRQRPFTGKVFVSCHVTNEAGVVLLQCDSRMLDYWLCVNEQYTGEFVLRTPWLRPGEYRIDLFLCSAGVIDRFEDACRLNVLPLLPYAATENAEATSQGLVFGDFDYRTSDEAPNYVLTERPSLIYPIK